MAYPDDIDSFRSVDEDDLLKIGDQNNMADAVILIETTLGTNPEGAKADVKTRLNDVDTALGGIALKVDIAGDTMTGNLLLDEQLRCSDIDAMGSESLKIGNLVSSGKISIGKGASVSASNGIAVGVGALANFHCLALGSYSQTSDSRGYVFGYWARVTGSDAYAIGKYIESSGNDSIVVGMGYGAGGYYINSVSDIMIFGRRYGSTSYTDMILSDGKFAFRVDSDEKFVITTVGIGVDVAVPTEKVDVAGTVKATGFNAGGSVGVSGSFTTVDLKTVTVTNGLITSIV